MYCILNTQSFLYLTCLSYPTHSQHSTALHLSPDFTCVQLFWASRVTFGLISALSQVQTQKPKQGQIQTLKTYPPECKEKELGKGIGGDEGGWMGQGREEEGGYSGDTK